MLPYLFGLFIVRLNAVCYVRNSHQVSHRRCGFVSHLLPDSFGSGCILRFVRMCHMLCFRSSQASLHLHHRLLRLLMSRRISSLRPYIPSSHRRQCLFFGCFHRWLLVLALVLSLFRSEIMDPKEISG